MNANIYLHIVSVLKLILRFFHLDIELSPATPTASVDHDEEPINSTCLEGLSHLGLHRKMVIICNKSDVSNCFDILVILSVF
jgi:hypothetical protein